MTTTAHERTAKIIEETAAITEARKRLNTAHERASKLATDSYYGVGKNHGQIELACQAYLQALLDDAETVEAMAKAHDDTTAKWWDLRDNDERFDPKFRMQSAINALRRMAGCMMEDRAIATIIPNGWETIKVPVYEWYWTFSDGQRWYVKKGKQPCAFYRFMQQIILGIKWVKL